MKDTAVGAIGCTFEAVLTITQTNEVFQLISLIATIVSTLVVLLFTVWKWYKKATSENSDGGKDITKEEIKDLVDDIKENTRKD